MHSPYSNRVEHSQLVSELREGEEISLPLFNTKGGCNPRDLENDFISVLN
jgi:hypothetical protein